MKDYLIAAAILLIGIPAAIGYTKWLSTGCELTGAMTWQGKVCLENLN